MKAAAFMTKSDAALSAARLLLGNGYADDACNRAHEIRLLADYSGDPVDAKDADELVRHATEFVLAIKALLDEPPATA